MKSLLQKLSALLRGWVVAVIPPGAGIILRPVQHNAHRSRPLF